MQIYDVEDNKMYKSWKHGVQRLPVHNIEYKNIFIFIFVKVLLTSAGTFWLYSVFCAISVVFVALCVPETKGISLEEIEKRFKKPSRISEVVGEDNLGFQWFSGCYCDCSNQRCAHSLLLKFIYNFISNIFWNWFYMLIVI